jgi:hypothetical protein
VTDLTVSAAPATTRRLALAERGLWLLPGFVAAVAVGALAAGRGGYFPTAWGWAAVPLCWAAAMALCLRTLPQLGRLELMFFSALLVFAGWIALSALWSLQPGDTVLEVERALVYPVGVLTVLLLARRAAVAAVLGGTLCGIAAVCGYALATRLFPERLGVFDSIAGYRLSHPVTYWNALGLLAAMGVLLAFNFALRAALPYRAVSAAALPVLLPTLYFTFSRGAWLALALGLVSAATLDPRRLQLASGLLLLAPAAIATWLASRSAALTQLGATLPRATHAGHRLALAVIALMVLSAAVALGFASAERRLHFGGRARRMYGGGLVLVVVGAIVVALVRAGGPFDLTRRTYDSFTSSPVRVVKGTSLNKRLFSFSSNGRIGLWHIAVHDFEAHPLIGSGAGTYEGVYLLHRPTSAKVRDAHSLYVETLAELGVVGLALLVTALLVPAVGAVRMRRHPLVPIAFGAYVAFVVHAGVDWDWEVTAVTLAGLLCGTAVLLAGREEPEATLVRFTPPRRVALFAITVAICLVSFVGLIGNAALASSRQAIVDGRWARAESQAERGIRWAPWSPSGRQYLGEAQFAQGQEHAGLADVRRAIRQDPRDWDLRWTLALLTHGEAQKQATLAALRLNPRSPELAEWIAGIGLKLPASVSGQLGG